VSDASHYARSMAEPTTQRHEPVRGRHLANRLEHPHWVVTLVAEVPPAEHIENLTHALAELGGRRGTPPRTDDPEHDIETLMRALAELALTQNEKGVRLARLRTEQRLLMRRGIAVTVE
jgi:hypothetical protein